MISISKAYLYEPKTTGKHLVRVFTKLKRSCKLVLQKWRLTFNNSFGGGGVIFQRKINPPKELTEYPSVIEFMLS